MTGCQPAGSAELMEPGSCVRSQHCLGIGPDSEGGFQLLALHGK